MSQNPIVLYTNHIINRNLCYNFALGSKSLMCHVDNFKDYNKTIATYGYLRGTGDIIKKVRNFYYMDHGYFKQSNRDFKDNKTKINDLDGYFRVVYNNYWHDGSGNKPKDRLNKLNLSFVDCKKSGEYIILSEPTEEAIKFYNLKNWTKNTINEIKKYSDREIRLHSRNSNVALVELLDNAWAFVSDHSSAGFMAMQAGVPAYFTNRTLGNIGKIENIEEHKINYSVFNNLAYEQWTIDEIKSGECWSYLSEQENND